MDEEEILRPHYANIKALVVMSGINILEEHYLLDRLDLNAEQLNLLNKIVHDKNHPWMIEYKSRLTKITPTNNDKHGILDTIKLIIIGLITIVVCFLLLSII